MLKRSVFVLSMAVLPVGADPVTDEIDAAKKAYEAGTMGEAAMALQQALAYVNEKKMAQIAKVLPDAVGEWKAEKVEQQNAAVFGGGGVVSRKYVSAKKYAKVQVMVDSPLMAQFVGMVNNPQMASAMGLQMRRVGTDKAFYNPKNQDVTMVLLNRFYIQVDGSRDCEEADVMEIVKGLKLDVLKNFK